MAAVAVHNRIRISKTQHGVSSTATATADSSRDIFTAYLTVELIASCNKNTPTTHVPRAEHEF